MRCQLEGIPDRPLDPPEPRSTGLAPLCDDCGFETERRWSYIVPVARDGWPKGAEIRLCDDCRSRVMDPEEEDAE